MNLQPQCRAIGCASLALGSWLALAWCFTAVAQTPQTLIPQGSEWEYLADGSSPGPGWNKPPWTPSNWPVGPAPLGYGRGDEATIIYSGPDDGPVTTYFRRLLVLTNASPLTTVTMQLVRDDAAVIYVNGTEVVRNNLPAGPLTPSTSALAPIDGAEEPRPIQRGVWPYYFVTGTNVIAVALHQYSTGRSDGRFDMELVANLPLSYPSVQLRSPPDGSILDPGPIRLQATADDLDGHVIYVQYIADAKILGNVSPPFDYVWADPEPGRHRVRARAIDNSGRFTDTNPIHIQVGDTGGSRLLRGPYLQNATTNSVVIRWRTDWFDGSRVQYGTSRENLGQVVEALTAVSEHEVALSNLQANTRYYYSIGSQEGVLSSGPDHRFTTLPTAAKPTRIWAIGDSGTANTNAAAVQEAYLNFAAVRPTDVWLMLGDNAYESGSDDEYQAAVFDMYPTMLRQTFLWPTLGNHDASERGYLSEFPFLDIFTLPRRGEAGGLASGTEKYYSFDYGNIHFVCLDSMSSDRKAGSAMRTWLEADLEATTGDWIIAYWHHPPYSWGTHHSDVELDLIDIREQIVPVLERNGVDLVLCGHSHNYERSWLLNGHYGLSATFTSSMKVRPGFGREDFDGAYLKPAGGQGASQGTVYVVCGCSGEGGYFNFARHPAMAVNLSGFGSMVIDIDGLRADIQFLDQFGRAQDYFTIRKDTPTDDPLPRLAVTRAGQQLTLAWPTSLRPFQLQTAPADTSPWIWTPLSVPTNVVGRQFRATLPVDRANRLFRLQVGP